MSAGERVLECLAWVLLLTGAAALVLAALAALLTLAYVVVCLACAVRGRWRRLWGPPRRCGEPPGAGYPPPHTAGLPAALPGGGPR